MENEAEAREKMRALMAARQSAPRPAEFVNPLEKIEQLLTCPICLDRYKQPKLLPCQHTFCYPCLENCADVLHRTLKCPECRAEHNVPYDGVKAFQSNYTLTGFLEIHLEATPESAAEIEEYIHRYNLEKCKICSEKADCEQCAHCDRLACKECRQTHMDMLKRDMSRILNQVKRLGNRITEASDNLLKGIDMMTQNCETTKTEVEEYFHRYQSELKKRKEAFLNEIDTFQANESRVMRNLHDVLEVESSNMSESVARLDAIIKGECVVDDAELVRLKNTFTEGLDYLRNFQPDTDDLFFRKLRFSAGDDASKMPSAIATCGELCVLCPQFSGRYLPLEQSYIPKPFRLPLESDNYRSKPVENGTSSSNSRHHSNYNRSSELDDSRYRRRGVVKDEPWNRTRNTTSQPVDVKSPWSAERMTAPPVQLVAKPPPPPQATPAASSVATPRLPRQQSSQDESLNEKVETIRRAHALRRAVSSSDGSDDDKDEEVEAPVINTSRGRIRIVCRAASVDGEKEAKEEAAPAKESAHITIPVTHYTGESDDQEEQPRSAEIPAWLARRRQRHQRSRTNPDLHSQFTSARVQQLLAERQQRMMNLDSSTTPPTSPTVLDEPTRRSMTRQRGGRSVSRDGDEWRRRGRPRAVFGRKGNKDGELNWPRGVCALPGGRLVAACDSSNHRVCVFEQRDGRLASTFGSYGSAPGQLDSPAGIACGKGRLVVTDRYNHRVCVFDLGGELLFTFGAQGPANARFNNPWGVAIDEIGSMYVADKENHRVQVFDKNGKFVAKFGSLGHLPGQLNTPLFIAVSRMTNQIYVSDSANHRISVFDANYMHLFSFGEEGFHGGQFKLPRGIAIDSKDNVIVADSGNNRIQVFDSNGQFISSFGTWGSGAGQLKGVEDVCVSSDGSIVVTDRENNRIQVF